MIRKVANNEYDLSFACAFAAELSIRQHVKTDEGDGSGWRGVDPAVAY